MAKRKRASTRKKKARSRSSVAPRRRKKATKTRARRNPRGRVIGDSAIALSYSGGEGKRHGKMKGPWEHEFESDDVEIIGLEDGSVKLRSKSGKNLWDVFEVEA